jgi:hypothetical protein
MKFMTIDSSAPNLVDIVGRDEFLRRCARPGYRCLEIAGDRRSALMRCAAAGSTAKSFNPPQRVLRKMLLSCSAESRAWVK